MWSKTITIVLAAFLLSSCATILSGSKQDIRLTSTPSEAKVLVNGQDKGLITPCMVTLKRKVKPSAHNSKNEYRFLFTKKGYANFEVIDYRKINPKVYANIFTWLFVIFAAPTDFITGAAYKYNDNVYANLQQLYIENQNISKNNLTKEQDKTPPSIKVLSPDLDRGFKQIVQDEIITIKGIVKDESGIEEIIINGVSTTVIADGSFEVNIPLQPGRNKIQIIAKDTKANMASESFYIERNDKIETEIGELTKNDFGEYYALIIGIENYDDPDYNDLDHPVSDAHKLYEALTQYYQFDTSNVVLLEDPGKEKITKRLEFYFEELSEKDNLLIFYAGHGYWDKKFKQGYWIPNDAKQNNRGTWLSNSTIRDYIRAIPSRHSLLVTDACFAGAIFKSRDALPGASRAINQLYNLPSKKAMTSGAMNQVPDKSVFLEYLIKRLSNNQQKYLPAEQLFASFKLAVINNSPEDQVPQFGEIKETGDEGGDFIFIRK